MHQPAAALSTPPPGLSVTEFARRAGVNRSTLHRIDSGAVEPTLATLRELALLHGLDLSLALRTLSDSDASTAARHLLDPAFDGRPVSAAVKLWIARFERLSPNGTDPLAIVEFAGRSSGVQHRKDAVLLRGDSSALRLASAGSAAGGRWAVSGKAALEFGHDHTVKGPSILWVDDVPAAAAAVSDTHSVVTSPSNAQVIVARADPSAFIDQYSVGPVRYVAPLQMVIDGIGLGGEAENEAMRIAREWSR